jgi:hypothetical protein
MSPRLNEQQQVLDVLLSHAPGKENGSGRVLAHGMGGLGKTTLSASIVRLEEVREHFERITFVSAGQEPATLELQRTMHLQLVGQPLDEKNAGTSESQREALQTAAAGKRWLVVLDDIWQVEHEHVLNFADDSSSPDCRVFVTTRSSRLLLGYETALLQFKWEGGLVFEGVRTKLLFGTPTHRYVEVALGLLSEPTAVELLLQTAEIDAKTANTAQVAAAKVICKGAGYLPLCVWFGRPQPCMGSVV